MEYGSITIFLERLPAVVQALVLEERVPFGRILREHNVEHTSNPAGFLRVEADAFLARELQVPEHTVLYGRRNTLSIGPDPIAEIVEILPLESDPKQSA